MSYLHNIYNSRVATLHNTTKIESCYVLNDTPPILPTHKKDHDSPCCTAEPIHKGMYWCRTYGCSLRCHILLSSHISFLLCFIVFIFAIFSFICIKTIISCSFKPGLLHSSLAGFEVLLRNVWVGKKSFLHDSLSFFGLGSPNLEMASLSRNHVSLSLFFFFCMAARGLSGATYVGTTPRLTDSSL